MVTITRASAHFPLQHAIPRGGRSNSQVQRISRDQATEGSYNWAVIHQSSVSSKKAADVGFGSERS